MGGKTFFIRTTAAFLMGLGTLIAQEQTGALEGRITDESGATVSGVVVTVSGPNIMGGNRTATTSDAGEYVIRQIPIGSVRVAFEKDGFAKFVAEGVRIQAGTVFNVSHKLQLASVSQSVTTTAEAPILDTSQNQVAFTYTSELMDKVPNARDAWALALQIPGLTSATYNVGGTNSGNQVPLRANGTDARQTVYILNGANVTDNTNNGASQFFFDVDSFEEMQVAVSGSSAEVQVPGIVLNLIPKSGTNEYHGGFSGYYTDDRLSSSNLDDGLRARGVTTPNKMRTYYDLGGDFGGPLKKDRLWFFISHRFTEVENIVTGTKLPTGEQPIDRTYLWYPTGKADWRINSRNNFSTFFNMAQKKRLHRDIGPLRPLETTRNQQGAPIARVFTFRDDWTVSPNLIVSLKASVMNQGFELRALPGVDVVNTPNQIELTTNRQFGAPPGEFGIGKSIKQFGGTVSWFKSNVLGGSHDLKFGFEDMTTRQFGNQGGTVAKNTYPADSQLRFFNSVPTEVILYASDASSVKDPSYSAFVQDNFHLGRLQLNLGVRWDRQGNSYDQVQGPKSRYFNTAATQQATGNVILWNTFAPRLGAIFDVTGKSKTLVKASYGRYYWQLWTNIADAASPAGPRSIRRRWNDLNGDKKFTIDEAGDILEVNDPAANPVTIDSKLKPTHTDEFIVGASHELFRNLAIGTNFFYRQDHDFNWTINRNITAADFTQVNGVDPGPTGVLGSGAAAAPLVFYEIAAAKRPLSPNFTTTRSGYGQAFKGVEFTANRRFANGFQMVASLTLGVQYEDCSLSCAVANNTYGPGSWANPQDVKLISGTRENTSTPTISKLIGSYQFNRYVKGLNVSGFFQHVSGTNFTRTVNSQSALGRSLNQGNIAVLSGERNQQSFDPVNMLDVRFGYDVKKFDRMRPTLALDLFNLLNINTVTDMNTLSGPAYGRVLNFINPRVVRLGLKLRF